MTSVSSHTARNLSFKHLEEWSSAGKVHRAELERIVGEIIVSIQLSNSPAKSLRAAMKKLNQMFARSGVRGEVHLLNNRHINFKLAFPTTKDGHLIFCLMNGEINARTGSVKYDLTNPIQMSLHALQRLFERLDKKSDSDILDEIYSCIGHVVPWHKGATEIEAKCWPLVSKNGFFIGTSHPSSSITSAVTWIKNSVMGKKWGLPIHNLSRLKEIAPKKLYDSDYAKEFIRSFPWMLHEHVPGEDQISLAWEQRDAEDGQNNQDEQLISGNSLIEADEFSNLVPKLSASYIAGMNYKNHPPNFKTNSLHSGIVVQKRHNSLLVVGLKNGWVGYIPFRSIERGIQLIPDYIPPDIGDEIVVSVRKINHFESEGVYALSLDPKEISDATWIEVMQQYPIGSIFNSKLLKKRKLEFIAQITSGPRGMIPAFEVHAYLKQPGLAEVDPFDINFNVVVTGYREDMKHLLLSIKNIDVIHGNQPREIPYKFGDYILGKCIRNVGNLSLVEISPVMQGRLHKFNNWGNELPEVGTQIQAIVIGSEDSDLLLGAISPRNLDRVFFAYPKSKDKWNEFFTQHNEGDIVEVQVLLWLESNMCYMVATSSGVVGTLPPSEIDWMYHSREDQSQLLKPGDIFNAVILKIHPTKSRAIFSKKALIKNPIIEGWSHLDLNLLIQAIVVNVMDYGYFVELQPSGIQALLHKTKVPAGKTFIKGQVLSLLIDVIDQEKNRISVKCPDDSLN